MKREIDAFLSYLSTEKGFSHNTIAAYHNDLYQLQAFIQGQGEKQGFTPKWSGVDHHLVLNYIIDLKQRGYSSSNVPRKVAAMKSLFNFLFARGIVESVPTEGLGSLKAGKTLPKPISVSEVQRLLKQPERYSTPEAKRDKAMLEVLYATGMRVSERSPGKPRDKTRGNGVGEECEECHQIH